MPLHLLVKWGRWFLQIVDIHVGNLNMKLTGRWFPQIVDRDSGNLYPIYIYITKIVVLVSEPVRGRSRATELPCFSHSWPWSIFILDYFFSPHEARKGLGGGERYICGCGNQQSSFYSETWVKGGRHLRLTNLSIFILQDLWTNKMCRYLHREKLNHYLFS